MRTCFKIGQKFKAVLTFLTLQNHFNLILGAWEGVPSIKVREGQQTIFLGVHSENSTFVSKPLSRNLPLTFSATECVYRNDHGKIHLSRLLPQLWIMTCQQWCIINVYHLKRLAIFQTRGHPLCGQFDLQWLLVQHNKYHGTRIRKVNIFIILITRLDLVLLKVSKICNHCRT